MNEDAYLLRRYAAEGVEDAFTALVQRHINFVYGCALRRVGGDRQAAEDVAQRVFVALARSAGKLTDRPSLVGWLHTTTRNVAAQYVRGERRRRDRENAAGAMSALDAEAAPAWEQLSPLRSLGATPGDAAKGSGAFVFRRALEGTSPPTPIGPGQPGDAANAAAPGPGRLQLKP